MDSQVPAARLTCKGPFKGAMRVPYYCINIFGYILKNLGEIGAYGSRC